MDMPEFVECDVNFSVFMRWGRRIREGLRVDSESGNSMV